MTHQETVRGWKVSIEESADDMVKRIQSDLKKNDVIPLTEMQSEVVRVRICHAICTSLYGLTYVPQVAIPEATSKALAELCGIDLK